MKKIDLLAILKNEKVRKYGKMLLLVLPFLFMDIFVRVMTAGVKYDTPLATLPSILFSAIWIGLFVGIPLCLKGRIGQIFYGVFAAVFFVAYMAHAVYYPYTGFFFSFHLLSSASEGSAYIWSTVLEMSLGTLFSLLFVLVLIVLAIIFYPRQEKYRWRSMGIVFAAFVVLHLIVPNFYGKANDTLQWDSWSNPRNVYNSFSDSNKSMKISGFYEYTLRDLYTTYLKPEQKLSKGEEVFLAEAYGAQTTHAANSHTGIFEGKNVIFIQLEGIDSWMLTEKDMPNLYGMMNHSIVFDNHYSYYNGGGSTFNSELAVTTGFLTPMSYVQNAYSFNTNYFPNTLPKLFKARGYSANAFHMNSGEYYMRELNYLNWGYDHYYGLLDDGQVAYTDATYELDTELVQNPFFYEQMFKQGQPFMHYLITYTPHTPFYLDTEKGKLLADRVYGDGNVPNMNEEEVAKFFASETDRMIGLLLQGLEENGLIDNTVIVAYADHYLYTIGDKSVLDKYKTTENNLINHTPFIIWAKDLPQEHVTKINSQLDILPTVLNLFGIEYNDGYYIGNDIMDAAYDGYVFFCDYSWYDGQNYVENGKVVNGASADEAYIREMNARIHALAKRNDLTLKFDYLKKVHGVE